MTYRKLDIPELAADPAIDQVILTLAKRGKPRARVLNLASALLGVPATTRQGIRFKLMVLAEFEENHDEELARAFIASIFADQDRLIGPPPNNEEVTDATFLSVIRQLTPDDEARALKVVKVMARLSGDAL